MSNFVHLQCHTQYSLLDGTIRVRELLARCKELGMDSVAVTDNGVMFGTIDFYLKAQEEGIKPIIGCELYVAKDMTKRERGWNKMVLLAQNKQGYRNLIRLVSLGHLDGFYYKPRVDMKALSQYTEGLIAISPGMMGPIGNCLKEHVPDEASSHLKTLKSFYGDRFYMGVHRLDLPMEAVVNEDQINMAADNGVPIVALNDVYFLNSDDAFLRPIVACIQQGRKLEDNLHFRSDPQEMYLKSSEDMATLFSDIPEALQNTLKISDSCQCKLETEQVKLPHFKCPKDQSPEDYLEYLVWEGISELYPEKTEEIKERVIFELSIINKMYYAIYFLIIDDFLTFAREGGIPIGPGRGSAAGSIVAYALGITKVDPIKYNLLFERFLNPERVSMPDIDLDFCIKRRSEVIDYIVQKYGADHVSQIVTFGSMAARGVVRDVGRVLDIPLSEVDRIAKLIPSSPGSYTSIPEAIETVPELKKMVENSEEIKELLDYGTRLEGLSRHCSTHAAGVVISRDALSEVVPLMKNEGQIVTQFEMTALEKIGLLKMDVLGLRNLTVIDHAVSLIQKNHGVMLDLDVLPLDDEKTYDMLCLGQTAGVFQLESRGMRQLIKDMKPRVFEDVIALLALYRPGPLGSGMVNEYLSNKSGKTTVKYDLPELEPILSETSGLILYQEQVMQIASVVGGFSLGEADVLRRAMGKKKKSEMDKMKDQFINGSKEKGFPLSKATKIFDLCYKFSEYGFNKSHSTAYALISFQTAYLKANYPKEYMAALLSSVLGSSDKTSLYIQECRFLDIHVLPPSVSESNSNFTVVEKGIRFGLGAVKNVGEGAIESIVQNRPYNSLTDFCNKIDLKQVNKRVIESLIKSGALDTFDSRGRLLHIYIMTLERAQIHAKERDSGQTNLFGNEISGGFAMPEPSYENIVEVSIQEKLKQEKDMLGLYISGHPLDQYNDQLKRYPNSIEKLRVEDEGKVVELGGLISQSRRVITRNKREMIIAHLENLIGNIPVILFQGDHFEGLAPLFHEDNIVYLKAKVRVNQDEISLICTDIKLISDTHRLNQLHIEPNEGDMEVLKQVKAICKKYKGNMPLYIHMADTTILTHQDCWVSHDELCLTQLQNLVGQTRVWVV
ncbi:MAG: DNA polymerase III subunit alpha [Candidatus Margulisbacteria bacterium]|nr:DNA polymerase III subunit alpha [Candidatus Margulisiibacteriota bacterium]